MFPENDHLNVNFAIEVLRIVPIEKNINMFIHLTNRTIVELMVVIKHILIHHVRQKQKIYLFENQSFLALRKHMKMHESSSESLNESSTKRKRTYNNSLTTDSCSQSPSSFENLAPMKPIPSSSSNYMYHHSTAFQQHYSGFNF
jgi:hypothetical protein